MIKKNRIRKTSVSIILALTMVFMIAQPALAKEVKNNSNENTTLFMPAETYSKDLSEYGIDGNLMMKVLEVSDHIYFNEDGTTLKTDLSDTELHEQYEFTSKQVTDFHAILDGTYQPPTPTAPLFLSRATRFYLSNADLTGGALAILGTAATAGPAALMAAWTGVSSALAGPLGTVAGLATAALGASFFADLAVKIMGALVQGKGVAFYLVWGIPPVKTVIE